MTVTTDKDVYAPSEPVSITVNVTNRGADAVTLTFPGPSILYKVTLPCGDESDLVVYDFLQHSSWLCIVWNKTLAPGETWSVSFDWEREWWPQTYDNGSRVSWPAYYRIWAYSKSYEPVSTASTTIFVGDDGEPLASFATESEDVSALMPLAVDATASTNLAGTPELLEYRWDWDGDGVWDTDWSQDPLQTHQYVMPGTYSIVLEVRDPLGRIGRAEAEVNVLAAVPEFSSALVPISCMLVLLVVIENHHRSRRR